MSHYEQLKDYHNPEDKLCLAQILDKIQFVQKRNQIEATDFFDSTKLSLIESFFRKIHFSNYYLFGGYEDAERKIILLFPASYSYEMVQKNYSKFLKVLRISFSTLPVPAYEHRIYLSGVIKLGIRREKVGDILVRPDGADLLIVSSMENILPKELSSLTRFRNATFSIESLEDLHIPERSFEALSIIVPSLRLDNLVSDLAKTSRSNACDLITSNLVFLNGSCDLKPSKQVSPGDIITIRRKGKFIFQEIEKTTKSGNLVLKISRYS